MPAGTKGEHYEGHTAVRSPRRGESGMDRQGDTDGEAVRGGLPGHCGSDPEPRSTKDADEAAGQSSPRSRRPGGLPRHGQGLAGADECDVSRPCAPSRQAARATHVLIIEGDPEQKAPTREAASPSTNSTPSTSMSGSGCTG